MTPDQFSRFESRTSPEPNTGCWLWAGAAISKGYGYLAAGGKSRRVHRLSFEHFVRPLVGDEIVCHKCDQPCCVNPAHLFAGTHKDNAQDRVKKGRGGGSVPPLHIGTKNHLSKLTDDDVRAIRREYLPNQKVYRGTSPRSSLGLALRYGVRPGAIQCIVNGKTWKHVQ